LMLLVLLPVPYVEASAATVFKSKYKRAMVGAAGVAAELFIAAIAFYLWLLVEPGLLRGILFNVMIIAGISTLLFNGNPLLRYDAYYVLADLIEIPNLATRSLAYWRYLTERYLFGESDADSPLSSRVEKAWFLLYGFGSTLYRILLTFVIALFIASQFFVIGVLLAIWAIVAMVVFPVTKGIRRFLTNPRLRRHRKRMVAVVAGIVLGLGGFLASVPMPSHSNAQGILWLPDDMIVRAGANGFLTEFIVGSGARVGHGAELIRLHDSILDVRVRLAEAKVAELEAEYNAQFATDRAEAQITNERLKSELANLDLVRERAGELTVRAATDGVFIAPQMVDLPGRYIHKGDLLGYVVGDRQPLVRVVVQQHVVDKVRSATERVRARLVDHPEIALTGNVLREVPAADEYLPSLALAPEGGGEIATDPRETENPKVLQRVFQFDMELDGVEQVDYFGQRVFVRFDHQMEPLALRWYRSIRLLFLKSFNV